MNMLTKCPALNIGIARSPVFKSFETSDFRRSEGLSVYTHVGLYIQPFSTRIDDVIKLINIDQFNARKYHPGIS